MSVEPQIERVEESASTNSQLTACTETLPHGYVLSARAQTAGRGQRGNSWEAEPGKNLTFSILLRPERIAPAMSFTLSMKVAIAVARTLSRLMDREVSVKWPNDIYVGDGKICGILIENSFCGPLYEKAVVGIGINVNQTVFSSDAPNPVSMAQICGRTFDLDTVLYDVCKAIIDEVDRDEPVDDLVARYHGMLWRREGLHRWHDNLTDEDLVAAIASVAPDGYLTLATEPPRTYAFKEVTAIL